jgi:hypothetical protein
MNRGRAKALFDKYGLPFEELDRPCSSDKDGVRRLRVEKPIRMRVRFACHNCSVVFGLSRICQNCEHVRCKECHRSPVRRAKEKSERKKLDKGKEPAQVESSVEGRSRGGFIQMPETTPSAADSQTMAQQIRTTCHRCEASFVPASAQICIACGHLKCSRCTNEWVVPQIEDGPTDVHVGDDSKQKRRRVYRKPRQRIRWYCHECQSIFIEGTKVCNECLHGRCEQCVRIP